MSDSNDLTGGSAGGADVFAAGPMSASAEQSASAGTNSASAEESASAGTNSASAEESASAGLFDDIPSDAIDALEPASDLDDVAFGLDVNPDDVDLTFDPEWQPSVADRSWGDEASAQSWRFERTWGDRPLLGD